MIKLSLSVRIAEAACKTRLNVPFRDLVQLAAELGYHAMCLRASAAGIETPPHQLERMRSEVESAGLFVSMVTADCDVPLNNSQGPNSLRNMLPSLEVAKALGATLIRVCLKSADDIPHAQRAADMAAEYGIRLAHQCHTTTLFEQVNRSLDVLQQIGRRNFGLIYEPANLMLCGENYGVDTLQRFQPWLMNVYLQNHRLDPDGPESLETWCLGDRRFHHLPIWQPGGVDFPQVMAALKHVGYDDCVTVHQAYGELMGPREAAQQTAEYLREIW